MKQSNTEDKRFKARLAYYEKKKQLPHDEAVRMANAGEKNPSSNGDGQPSKWAQRQAEKRAREEATKVRPLMLHTCPECETEFWVKKSGKYEPIKLSSCPQHSCALRFYYAKNAQV